MGVTDKIGAGPEKRYTLSRVPLQQDFFVRIRTDSQDTLSLFSVPVRLLTALARTCRSRRTASMNREFDIADYTGQMIAIINIHSLITPVKKLAG